MRNLNHSLLLAEPYDVFPSKIAILKLWRYLRLTDHPNFFTPSGGLLVTPFFFCILEGFTVFSIRKDSVDKSRLSPLF
jgi:hypothetical protein